MSSLHADRFPPLEGPVADRWAKFPRGWDRVYFPNLVGLELEEVRTDYARMRLPYRPELDQPAGVVHGGAIATLIDTVVVPAIGGHYDEPQCQQVCPVSCIPFDPDWRESKDELQAKYLLLQSRLETSDSK